ncbi:MAG: efflux RND transporter periplasmic adaptor subunit [Aestuariibacter sp.]
MANVINTLRRQPAWVALIIFLLLVMWVVSGMVSGQTEALPEKIQQESPLQKVQVTTMLADEVHNEVTLYGRTEPDRTAMLRSEINGQVISIFVEEGQQVKTGEPLVKLDENDLPQRLASAKATLKQRHIELEGSLSLGRKGYQSQVTQAQSEANVAAAEAAVKALQLALENTLIVAPYDGVIDRHFIEVGDYLRDGDNIATVVDLDPLVIRADVTENDVQELRIGQPANGRLPSGKLLQGTIRYIASVSNEGTNTFKVEVAVPNATGGLLAGMSTEVVIPLESTWAMHVTPALMALSEAGELGVKVVDDDVVHFVPINMVKSDNQGVWLTGLGQQADIITLGQGFVKEGDKVEVVRDQQITQVLQ